MSSPITELDEAQLVEAVRSQGGRDFQARQISHWLYRHSAGTWDDCSNLPGALRAKLAEEQPLRSCSLGSTELSRDGTRKMLVQLGDGEAVEAVLIPEGKRQTLCLSTQVGCPVGCIFCASGLDGLRRNLTRGEIIEQVLLARELLPPRARLTNLVVMGMGEPMLNLDELLPALERCHDPEGINLGARRITVSSSGYPKMIDRFAEAPHAYNLAISLHAANEELRRKLVPNARCTVAELLASAKRYFERKKREVTFEVVLLAGCNDRREDARDLIATLDGFPCTVNLIPWNQVDRISDLARPSEASAESFAEGLRAGGLKVTLRRQRGADRSAACGQLRLAIG